MCIRDRSTLLPAPFPAGPAGASPRPRHRGEGFFEFVARRPGGSSGAPLPVEDLGGFAALAGARYLLGRLRPTWRPCWLAWPRWPCCASCPGTAQREAGVRRRAAFGRGLAARPGHRPRCAPFLPAYRWLSYRTGEEAARAVRIRANTLLRCTCGRRAGAGLRRPPEVVMVN